MFSYRFPVDLGIPRISFAMFYSRFSDDLEIPIMDFPPWISFATMFSYRFPVDLGIPRISFAMFYSRFSDDLEIPIMDFKKAQFLEKSAAIVILNGDSQHCWSMKLMTA